MLFIIRSLSGTIINCCSLTAKISILAVSLVLMSAGAIGFMSFSETQQHLIDEEIHGLRMETDVESTRIGMLFDGYKKDARMIASAGVLLDLLNKKTIVDAEDKALMSDAEKVQIVNLFEAIMKVNPDYLSIRIVQKDKITATDAESLLSVIKQPEKYITRSGEYISDASFVEAFKNFSPSDPLYAYLTDITLLHEGGKVFEPFVPIMKAMAPIYIDEHFLGVIELTVKMEPLLVSLDDSHKIEGHLDSVVNSNGFYLRHLDSRKTFGFERDTSSRIQDDYSEVAIMFDRRYGGALTTKTFDEGRFVHFHKIFLDDKDASRFIGLVETLSHQGVDSRVAEVTDRILVVTIMLIVIAAVLAWLFSRLITRPLKGLIQATARVASGDLDVQLTASSRDELGILTKSFNSMTKRLRYASVEREDFAGELRDNAIKLEAQQNALDEHAIVSITDKTGQITYVNDKFCQISQYSFDELVGHDHSVINSGFHDKKLWQEMWRTIGNGVPWHGEVKNKKKDGEYYWVDTTIMPFLSDNGKPYQYISIRTDITKIKEHEKQFHKAQDDLHHAQKMNAIGVLAGGIAHDFNNILMVILNYAEMIQMEAQKGSAQHEDATEIVKSCDRAQQLIDQILNFSRKKEKRSQLFRPLDITRDVVKLIKATMPSNVFVDADLDLDRCNVYVNMDPMSFHHIVMNVCVNAGQAIGQDRGTLSIKLEQVALTSPLHLFKGELRPGKYTRLSIKDTGSGIKEQDMPHIFDPFFTTKEVGEGTGLGLAEAYGIIMDAGGGIVVDSRPNEGTQFDIYIPVAEKEIVYEAAQKVHAL